MTTQILTSDSSLDEGHEKLPALPNGQLDADATIPSTHDRPSFSEIQSETASINDKLRNSWEESMKGFGSTGTPKKKAAVLMISWHESIDDMDTSEEVEKLGSVFEKQFRYTVIKKELTRERPSHQINTYLSSFVMDYDDDSTLLIVYYAGHGMGNKPGELHLTGCTGNGDPTDYLLTRDSIPWHDTEFLLKNVTADVLLIFDCCYAGNLTPTIQGRGQIWPTRGFEYLAACPYNECTHPPGRKSFTTALIWALDSLLKARGTFTTHELQQKIMKEAPNFPRKQIVEIQERGQPCDQRLVLAPLPEPNSSENGSGVSDGRVPPQNFIDLRVWYSIAPNEAEIRTLASIMRRIIIDRKITASNIAWVHFGNHMDPVRKVLDKWQSLLSPGLGQRLRSTPTNLNHEIRLGDQGDLQPPHTPPPSDSGRSSMEDGHTKLPQPVEGYSCVYSSALGQDENVGEFHKSVSEISVDILEEGELRTPEDMLTTDHCVKSLTTWMCNPISLVACTALYICVDRLVLRPSLSYRPA
ncbi:hypothetical protein BP5796_02832 [Coleophoma crateriformis]|uniref:Peptidase C14 caspase domain-containing protein n=1 Tax=Coleophoma crateriformis TaxID=565419 RepID=A0A3D8SZB5_9HELO|nr:hypothetical protein BP5796_02832 [Coleophoma crateriformis]